MTEFYFCGEGKDDDCFTMAGRWKIISPAFSEKNVIVIPLCIEEALGSLIVDGG